MQDNLLIAEHREFWKVFHTTIYPPT